MRCYTSLPNFNWNENRLVSEHQTSDASIGYSPGLIRERLIFFVRNTVKHGFSQKNINHREKDEIVLFTTRSYSVS
jgi:hypothetical protein